MAYLYILGIIKKKKQEEREKRLRDLWEGEDDKTAVERVVKDNWDEDDYDDDDDDDDDAGGHIRNNNKESMKKDKEISTLEVKLQVVGKEKSVDKAPNMRRKVSIEDDYQENKIKKLQEIRKIALDRNANISPKKRRRKRSYGKRVVR
uniref:Serine/threonine-protein kinase rio2-like n=1 Tax=Crassostrea virginica TaxID=6565 RepID=A0A8B8BQA4_CRAVI|nr:serine/threonine-protein kinase rio2-like [Crassostrea virginica]